MNKEILRLAIPNIISNVSVPLLSAVDTALMGKLPDPKYLGAIALGGMIFNFLYWNLGFLRMGTTGLTAQAFGKKNDTEMSATLGQSMMVALGLAMILLLFQFPILKLSLWTLGGSEGVQELSRQYFYIRIWATPAALGLLAINGWFFGMQNARYPMLITVLINVSNIVFNLIFVKGMGMNADGVALGTVLAQFMGFALGLFLLWKTYRPYLKKMNRSVLLQVERLKRFFGSLTIFAETIDVQTAREHSDRMFVQQLFSVLQKLSKNRFFMINRDIFIRTVALVFVFTFFSAISARSGDIVLAANQILLLFLSIISYAIDGFAHASESLVGKYKGAKDGKLLKKSIQYSFRWGMGFSLVFILAYALFGKEILGLFTDNPEVFNVAAQYLFWLAIMPLMSAGAYIWDGIYIGATAVKPMRNAMIVSTTLIFLPLYFLLAPSFGNHALWAAMLVFMLSRTVLLWALSKKYIVV